MHVACASTSCKIHFPVSSLIALFWVYTFFVKSQRVFQFVKNVSQPFLVSFTCSCNICYNRYWNTCSSVCVYRSSTTECFRHLVLPYHGGSGVHKQLHQPSDLCRQVPQVSRWSQTSGGLHRQKSDSAAVQHRKCSGVEKCPISSSTVDQRFVTTS